MRKSPSTGAAIRPCRTEEVRGQGGIKALLEGMQEKLRWAPVTDGAHIIGLFDATEAAEFPSNLAVNSNSPARRSRRSIKPAPSSTAIF